MFYFHIVLSAAVYILPFSLTGQFMNGSSDCMAFWQHKFRSLVCLYLARQQAWGSLPGTEQLSGEFYFTVDFQKLHTLNEFTTEYIRGVVSIELLSQLDRVSALLSGRVEECSPALGPSKSWQQQSSSKISKRLSQEVQATMSKLNNAINLSFLSESEQKKISGKILAMVILKLFFTI